MGYRWGAMYLDVLFGPAEFSSLPARDLRGSACVVFDILRATTTAVTALANGAVSILPVSTIGEAVEERRRDPERLLAGERGGWRIGPELTGGITFDFGNSPREFVAEKVRGRRLVMTTTNGTRALRASAGAGLTIAAAFANLGIVVAAVVGAGRSWEKVLLVCSGTGEDPALEDTLAAGACVELMSAAPDVELSDAAEIAMGSWKSARPDWPATLLRASNARRLLALPDLAPDVGVCLRRDVLPVVPRWIDGELRLGQ